MKKPYRNVFPSLTALFEQYAMPCEQIVYEGKSYRFVETLEEADECIDVYHNKEDQHFVKIHLASNKPYYIDTYYHVEECHATV
ncbi:hypothetical protein [Metasolibacillus meyeri]|uniref:hypothetical protein n=1 Tax=Metasolibacillus meyeri TaxID=1071052 RepID=UPI000D2FF3EE|nr:hypothetical protein [Metasolibacillus meyeri]